MKAATKTKPRVRRATKTTKATKPTKPTARTSPAKAPRSASRPARTTAKLTTKGAPKVSARAGAKAKKTPARRTTRAASAPASASSGQRADFGAPVDRFFAKQPAHIQPITNTLRALVEEAARDATAVIKWGVPVYEIGGKMMCSISAHKAHVNLVLWGKPSAFPDPRGKLSGAKSGRHLKVTSVDEIPRADARRWLKAAAELARARA